MVGLMINTPFLMGALAEVPIVGWCGILVACHVQLD